MLLAGALCAGCGSAQSPPSVAPLQGHPQPQRAALRGALCFLALCLLLFLLELRVLGGGWLVLEGAQRGGWQMVSLTKQQRNPRGLLVLVPCLQLFLQELHGRGSCHAEQRARMSPALPLQPLRCQLHRQPSLLVQRQNLNPQGKVWHPLPEQGWNPQHGDGPLQLER